MTTKEFGQEVIRDEALRKKMHEVQTLEEGYAIARGMGVTDDQDTFLAEMKKGYMEFLREHREIDMPNMHMGELGDDQLINISGGKEDWAYYIGMCGCA